MWNRHYILFIRLNTIIQVKQKLQQECQLLQLDVGWWTEEKISVGYSACAVLLSYQKLHRRCATVSCSTNSPHIHTLKSRGSPSIKCVNSRWILVAGKSAITPTFMLSYHHLIIFKLYKHSKNVDSRWDRSAIFPQLKSTTHSKEIALGPEVSQETSTIPLDAQRVMQSHFCLSAQ